MTRRQRLWGRIVCRYMDCDLDDLRRITSGDKYCKRCDRPIPEPIRRGGEAWSITTDDDPTGAWD